MKMVLVDTSVWVRHFREGDPNLERLLGEGEVLCHPFIVGELACGNLKNRQEILSLLQLLPLANQAKHEETQTKVGKHSETNHDDRRDRDDAEHLRHQ